MDEVVRVINDLVADLGYLAIVNDILQEPEAFGYNDAGEVLRDILDVKKITFMLETYKEEIILLLFSGKLQSEEKYKKLVSMMEEIEWLFQTENYTELFFKVYELFFFSKEIS